MAAKKKGGSKKDPRLARAGVSGYNKPKRTPPPARNRERITATYLAPERTDVQRIIGEQP